MQHFHGTVQDTNGTAIASATVTVRVQNATPGSGALATIYSDNGVTTIVGSAVTTDANGRYDFFAPDGRYDLVVTGSFTTFILDDVEISDVTQKFASDLVHTANVFDAGTGFRIAGAATSGEVLRGDGTNFVSAQLAVGDLASMTSAQLAAKVSDETGSGALVFGTSPTIVTPTIASFANAVHDHEDAAGGGLLPGPESQIVLYDDFVVGSSTTGEIGALGWGLSASATGIITVNHGVFDIQTSASNGNLARLHLAGGVTGVGGTLGRLDVGNWHAKFYVRLPSVSVLLARVGLAAQASADPPDHGFFFLLDTATDGEWRGIARNSAVQSVAGGTVTADTNFTRFEIIANAAGTSFEFLIDDVSLGSLTTNIPIAGLAPFLQVKTLENVAKSLYIDYFYFKRTGLTR